MESKSFTLIFYGRIKLTWVLVESQIKLVNEFKMSLHHAPLNRFLL